MDPARRRRRRMGKEDLKGEWVVVGSVVVVVVGVESGGLGCGL